MVEPYKVLGQGVVVVHGRSTLEIMARKGFSKEMSSELRLEEHRGATLRNNRCHSLKQGGACRYEQER